MLDIDVAILNCTESLLSAKDEKSAEEVLSILQEQEVLVINDDFKVYQEVLGHKFIAYLRQTAANGLDVREHFARKEISAGRYKLVPNILDMRTFFEILGYTNTDDSYEFGYLTKLTGGVFIIQQEYLVGTYFHEMFLPFMLLANNNMVIFVNKNNEPSPKSTMQFYVQYTNVVLNKDLPAYLKIKVSRMLSKGSRALFNPICGWFRFVEIKREVTEPVRAIKLSSVSSYLAMKSYYSQGILSYEVTGKKNLLGCDWGIKQILLGDVSDIQSPIEALTTDSYITRNQEALSTFRNINFQSRNTDEHIVNGFKLSQTTNPLDRIYREGFLQLCNYLSDAFYDKTKNVFMQDVAILIYKNEPWVTVIDRLENKISSSKEIDYYVPGLKEPLKSKNHATYLPVVDKYYTDGHTCTPLDSSELETLKECLLYQLSYLLDYGDSFTVGMLTSVLSVVTAFTGDMLSHNNYYFEDCYNSLNILKLPANVRQATLDSFGRKAKYAVSDLTSQTRIDVSI